jgi:hypothetical protein
LGRRTKHPGLSVVHRVLTAKARQAGCKAVQARADARAAAILLPPLPTYRQAALAAYEQLNRRGIQTPRGVGEWQAGSVSQLLARLA